MIFNLFELLDIVIMTLVIGYIFNGLFRRPTTQEKDILDQYRTRGHAQGFLGVDWHDFLWACALVAPSIIVHELGHKFVAMSFGLDATFHAACSSVNLLPGMPPFLDFYCGLTIITILLKAIGIGFFFFIPAFVSVGSGGTSLQLAAIAVAGPLVNLAFWLGAAYVLRDKRRVKRLTYHQRAYLFFFKQINMLLFIFNMLPIPGFDGFNFLYNLVKAIFHI